MNIFGTLPDGAHGAVPPAALPTGIHPLRFIGRLLERNFRDRNFHTASAGQPATRRDHDATIPGVIMSPAASYRQRARRDRQAPSSFVVVGDAADRKAFTATIRAFALAKRFGDHLTIIGYGPHRRRLQKWTIALRIDHIVTFADRAVPPVPCFDTHDIAILLAHRPERIMPLRQALIAGLRVVAMNGNPAAAALLADECLGTLVASGDCHALASAMTTVRCADRATVLNTRAPYLVQDTADPR